MARKRQRRMKDRRASVYAGRTTSLSGFFRKSRSYKLPRSLSKAVCAPLLDCCSDSDIKKRRSAFVGPLARLRLFTHFGFGKHMIVKSKSKFFSQLIRSLCAPRIPPSFRCCTLPIPSGKEYKVLHIRSHILILIVVIVINWYEPLGPISLAEFTFQ